MEIILKYFSDFSAEQLEQFRMLEGLYKEWNEKINVISRKDIDGLYEKHVLHSLSIAAVFDFGEGSEIADLGTGGGFPGLPLAIFFPAVKFYLVDSIAKKLKVVEAIASAIGLENLSTHHSRFEEIKNRKFDYVVSRAVAPLKDLWKWSNPLLKNPGSGPQGISSPENRQATPGLICLKGGDLHQEIRESGLRARMLEIHEIFPEEYFRDKYILHVPAKIYH